MAPSWRGGNSGSGRGPPAGGEVRSAALYSWYMSVLGVSLPGSAVSPQHPGSRYSRYFSRSADLRNLPVEVRGMASMNSNASGTQYECTRPARNPRSSSALARAPSRSTTTARGRSTHFGCDTATTAASFTAGWPIRAFSTATELIHSPPDLIRSLVRSVRFRYPCESMVTTSPVLNQPSFVQRSSDPSMSVYDEATQGPRTWSSPWVRPSHGTSRPP